MVMFELWQSLQLLPRLSTESTPTLNVDTIQHTMFISCSRLKLKPQQSQNSSPAPSWSWYAQPHPTRHPTYLLM